MVISDDYITQSDTMLCELNVRFCEFQQGPDGYIYILTEGRLQGPKDTGGMLLRLEPSAASAARSECDNRGAASQASPD
jgi:hypothetical protein